MALIDTLGMLAEVFGMVVAFCLLYLLVTKVPKLIWHGIEKVIQKLKKSSS